MTARSAKGNAKTHFRQGSERLAWRMSCGSER